MTSERWEQIEKLLHATLEIESSRRAAFLDQACAGDEDLRREVESLLAYQTRAENFIESPAIEYAAGMLGKVQSRSAAGRKVGPYELVSLIAAGGMGEVYLAEDTRLGRKIALKLLPMEFTQDLGRVRRFEQEARAASALNHPNILTVYDIGQAEGIQYIATEFIEGQTLRQHIAAGTMDLRQALDVGCQVASALSAAHEAGIVHRDIKPENIMVRQDGYVKVLDFGLAKLAKTQGLKVGSRASTVQMSTQAGVILGTVNYMSPEQARGQEMDARTDIFSFGVVLYEMIAGRAPFAGPTSADVIASILERQPPALAQLTGGVPEALERIVSKSLRKDRDERYQTAKDLLADLKTLRRRLEFEEELERSMASNQTNVEIADELVSASSKPAGAKPQSHEWRSRNLIDSLAILPLTNTSADPSTEYFSDGITESIINTLSRLPELRVMAWSTVSRYRSQQIDPREVGRDLRVRAVLTGRLMQLGERIVIKTELVDASDGSHLWGESYTCKPSDILDVEAEIASEISEKLLLRLTTEERKRLAKRYTDNIEAYHAYLKGRHFWSKRTDEGVRQGIEHFEQAIDMDPSYALAYAGLADSYIVLGSAGIATLPPNEAFPKAREAAARALDIDDTLAEAHTSLGTTLAFYYWDWPAAEKEFKRSIELKPAYTTGHHWYGFIYLVAMGLLDEAIRELKRAHELDPLSLGISTDLGLLFYLARRYNEAIGEYRKTLEMDRNFVYSHWKLGLAYEQQAMYEEAIAEFQKAIALSGRSTLPIGQLGHTYAVSGKTDDALKTINKLNELSKERYVSPYRIAAIYAGLEEKEQAFRWLERAYDERDASLIWLKFDPVLDSLRSDRRFTMLLRRIGLANDSGQTGDFPPIRSSSRASRSSRPTPSRIRRSRKTITSLAILPFVNNCDDPGMEYFNDGITETIINTLSHLPKLRVVARSTVFRYKDQQADPREVGRLLEVQAVLTGRVRQIADRLIIGAELIDVASDSQLWGEHFNRNLSDIFAVQEEIAKEITEKLQLKLSRKEKGRLAKRHTHNVEAYQAYLKGRYHWNKRTAESLNKGVEYFKQAIDTDPAYAPAYAGLSDSYTLLVVREAMSPEEGFAKAKAAAAMALKIDEAFAEAHASLGHALLHNWEWDDAEVELKRAIELNPGYASAHHWYSEHLTAIGRCDESIAELKLAGRLDPLSLIISADLGRAFYYAREYDQVMKQEAKTLEMDSNFWLSHINLGRSYTQKGMHAEAISELQKARDFLEGNTEALSFLGFAYAAAGKRDEALKILHELDLQSKRSHVPPYHLAIVHAGRGEKDQAFGWLEQAFEKRAVDLFTLKVEPMFDRLRSDPRFQDLLRRVGLAPPQTSLSNKPESQAGRSISESTLKGIAVLPFKPINAEQRDEYLELGIADALITRLTNINQIAVRPTSAVRKYTSLDQDPLVVGRELRVESVLEGSIQKLGDRIRVTAQLVGVEDGRSLWAARFDERLTDIFAVEDSISERVAAALALKLTGEEMSRLTKHYTENVEAYQAYLKGRFFWNKRTTRWFKRGIEFFQQAIERDPDYALAYAGLADSYTLLVTWEALTPEEGFSQAKTAARKALEIDSTLAEAHAGLAHTLLHTWEWSESESEFKRAIDLNPGYALTHQWYSEYLAAVGRFDESIAEIKRALELDPLSVNTSHDVGRMLYLARRYDEAIEQLKQTIEMESSFWSPHNLLGQAYTQKAMYEEAIAEFQKAMDFSGKGALSVILVGHAYAASGKRSQALAIIDKLTVLAKERYFSPYRVALIYAGLGYKDEMFEWLERAYEKRDANLIWLKVDPILDDFRSEAHFTDLMRRVRLARPSSGEIPKSSPYKFAADTKQATDQPALRAIAVLPFKPISTQGRDEYLELGMADALITKLSDINQIVVRPTSSVRKYTDLEQDSAAAGRELGVESVLEGSIQKLGDRIRVTARLVSVEDGRSLWTGKFDEGFTDIFAVEDSISEKVAAALAVKLTSEEIGRLTKRYTENTAAYHLYLKGRYYWNKRSEESLLKSVECFNQAIEIDPNYALPYAGVADCYTKLGDVGVTAMTPREAFARAHEAALRALEIDSSLAEVHASLGHLDMHHFQWADAERDFKRAIELNPNYATAHHWYAYFMLFHHQFDEALERIGIANRLDPLSLPIFDSIGEFLYFTRRTNEAIEQFVKTLEMDPGFLASRINLGRAYEQAAMFSEAEEQFIKARQSTGESIDALAGLGHTYALASNRSAALDVLDQLTDLSKERYVSPYDIALIHAALGETDDAFQWLEKAFDECAEWIIFTNVDPRLDPLRRDARFGDLLGRLGFAV